MPRTFFRFVEQLTERKGFVERASVNAEERFLPLFDRGAEIKKPGKLRRMFCVLSVVPRFVLRRQVDVCRLVPVFGRMNWYNGRVEGNACLFIAYKKKPGIFAYGEEFATIAAEPLPRKYLPAYVAVLLLAYSIWEGLTRRA